MRQRNRKFLSPRHIIAIIVMHIIAIIVPCTLLQLLSHAHYCNYCPRHIIAIIVPGTLLQLLSQAHYCNYCLMQLCKGIAIMKWDRKAEEGFKSQCGMLPHVTSMPFPTIKPSLHLLFTFSPSVQSQSRQLFIKF